MSEDKNNSYFAPFAMEDLGDITLLAGKKNEASSVYANLLAKFPALKGELMCLRKSLHAQTISVKVSSLKLQLQL
jgi:predicted negative regulator of RcsB-dependent stress response